MGDEVEKIWCGASYARPLAGFKGAASRRGGQREGRGEERKGRKGAGRKRGKKVGTGPLIG